MRPQYKRTRLWIDPPFQLRLLVRMVLYLVVYMVAVFHIAFALELMVGIATNGARKGFDALYLDFLTQQKTMLVTLVLVAPILLYDLLKFSHRVAGPLYRCRTLMQEMAAGKVVPEFHPRKRDLMRELFQAFNALIKHCNSRVRAQANGHPVEEKVTGVLAGAATPGPVEAAVGEPQQAAV